MKEILSPEQRSKVAQLIKNECINHQEGQCLLLERSCPQAVALSVCCMYFRQSVLPLDGELTARITKQQLSKVCPICGKSFLPSGNRSIYCDVCSVQQRRKQKNESERKRRQKVRSCVDI